MRIATSNSVVDQASGAFGLNDNLATTAGLTLAASGGALAVGVGFAVAPAATLGLASLGGGLVVAGNLDVIKDAVPFGKSADDKAVAPAAA